MPIPNVLKLLPPTRLSAKLLYAILPPTLLAICGVAWLQYHLARTEILGAINKEINFLAQRTADNVDELLDQRRRDLFTLSETPLIADHYHNVDFRLFDEAAAYRKELELYLSRFAERSASYARMWYLDAGGREIVRVPARAAEEAHSRRDYFVQARTARRDEWTVSSIETLAGVGSVLYFAKPIRDERDVFRGALVLAYDLSHLREALRAIEVGRRGRAYLRTGGGRTLEGRPVLEAKLERLSASRSLKRQPWTVVVEAPFDDFLGPLRTIYNATMLIAAVAILALASMLLLLVRSITRPIATLVEAARAVGAGYLSHRIPEPGPDELGTLAVAFNRMTSRLERNSRLNSELQAQLIQAEKLSAVGQLIASVAHELNNPLGAISGYAQMALLGECPPALKDDMRHVYDNVLRCRKVVDNLLFFVRKSRHERKKVDLNRAASAALELLEYRLLKTEDVAVVKKLADPAPEVAGDFQELVQVLLNLINNACDAMRLASRYPEGKRLVVSTGAAAGRAFIAVEDNGPGVPEHAKDSVFLAFFTTKSAGHGTGLGLSICRQIAQDHGGDVSFENRASGCVFRLELPEASPSELDRLEAPAEPVEHPPVPGKRVLVADDEMDIAELIARLLREDGDEVQVVLRGDEALKLLETNSYDLLISDVEMEHAKGSDLYAKLVERGDRASDRVLFVTGDVLNARVLEFFSRTGCEYLVKPFDIHELRQTARRLLARF
ncbi:MAG: response regulator [Elusimicrobia bacterium]|nr:response regulator [Elusimicrobiota bacterium]